MVNLDMTDPTTSCPSGWQLTGHSKRSCGKVSSGSLTCDSVFFPVAGGAYTKVCGTIRGYQNSRTDAFEAYDDGRVTTIDGAYVSGVSLTHGSPGSRQHIWTFAAGASEDEPTADDSCPCDATISIDIPPFVSGNYFCESGSNFESPGGFYPDDPLWDGQNCTLSSTCCSMNNPPYFTKQLSSPTTDDIEVRICQLDSSDDTPIDLVELYVKGPNDEDVIDLVSAIVSKEHQETRGKLEEHNDHINFELVQLHINHDNTDFKLDSLDLKQDELSMELTAELQETEKTILNLLFGSEIGSGSGTTSNCNEAYPCGGEEGWRRVVNLDMTDPTTSCPSGWQLTGHSKRSCGKVSSGSLTCDSVFFPVAGGAYTKVCGTIRGYQNSRTDAFEAYDDGRVTTIDGAYVSGVSLTHGSPGSRQHIWTFAAGASEAEPTADDSCPCDATISIDIPPFVSGNYFCESGSNFESPGGFYPDDPLWDGQNCTLSSTCCSMNNPPYFTKQLSSPTTDDIEVRICQLDSSDDTPIDLVELYVKGPNDEDVIDLVSAIVSKEHQETRGKLEEHNDHINFELVQLHINHDNTDFKLDSLDLKQDELSMELTAELQETEKTILNLLFGSEIGSGSGTTSNCNEAYPCGGEEGWRRAVYLDMTDPTTSCPSGWQLIESPRRLCVMASSTSLTCDSAFFPVTGGPYSRVCGRIIGYQHDSTDAFEAYDDGAVTTIDGAYVAGVSLTHGSPRQHIWTFASGRSEVNPTWDDVCPCDANVPIAVPPFVGEDYFCESGGNTVSDGFFLLDDPLWDGRNCTSTSTCCSLNNPPYFVAQLPTATTDEIEARMCQQDGGDEDTPIEFIELYVKGPNDEATGCASKTEAIASKLDYANAILREEHAKIRGELEEHKNHVNSELVQLQINQNNIDSKLDTLELKQDQLITARLNDGYTCNGEGGWRRVVNLDMTDPTTSCPSGWQLTGHSKRTCGKVSTGSLTCDSVFFPVNGRSYNRVCGKIRGYQLGQTDAFEAYHSGQVTTIDGAYISGVSLTHGSPRQHIWTFAAGASEAYPTWINACPCDASINITVPPFVGGDYFCESGAIGSPGGFHPDDPLWDGQGCTSTSTCCSFNNPPYFTKHISSRTTDDIEARICQWGSSEDSPIEFIELYVKDGDGPFVSEADVIISKLDSVSAVLKEEYQETRDELEEHVNHMNSELVELHINHNNTDSRLDSLESKQDEVISELHKSSDYILERMWLYSSEDERGWRRVVHLNMTDPNTNCPSGWQLTGHPKRTCGKVTQSGPACDSVFFPVTGGPYTKVRGIIRAYQYSVADAFEAYDDGLVTTIDGAYVAGVSLTHGSPRQHIWTFAAGGSETAFTRDDSCPCDATIDISVPPFVGRDYFCESGNNPGSSGPFYQDDPLWDGKGCSNSSTCCSFNNPPYFIKQLSSPTTDDIEARFCHLDGHDAPIEFIELFVKDESYSCGSEGGWTRVVYLDMTDPNSNCPSGWQLTTYSRRTCGQVSSGIRTCNSVFFPVTGGEYTKVCGKIIGYQLGQTDAFEAYDDGLVTTIDGAYVAGVSLTHGSPRQHIWTFAAGISETAFTGDDACPCDAIISINVPPFVGTDYFCESGSSIDPLWDGQGCTSTSTCCSFNNPPYFTKQLSSPTTDSIEARICRNDGSDHTPIEFIELYVK